MSVDDELAPVRSSSLARALHDAVLQRLAGVAVALGADAPLALDDRRRAGRELDRAIEELRAVITAHLGGRRSDVGGTLSEVVHRARLTSTGPAVRVRCEGDAKVSPDTARFVEDFVGEAVRNAIKHAHPREVTARVRVRGHAATIEVANDGVAPRAEGRGSKLGLRLIAAEAARMGGRLDYGAEPHGGWRASLTLPLAGVADAEAQGHDAGPGDAGSETDGGSSNAAERSPGDEQPPCGLA